MKKILAFFMAFSFVFLNLFCNESIYARKVIESDDNGVAVVSREGYRSYKNIGGVRNVVNHPFAIIFRSCSWGILGCLSSILLPFFLTKVLLFGWYGMRWII